MGYLGDYKFEGAEDPGFQMPANDLGATAAQDPSMWSKLGDWLGNNKSVLSGIGLGLNQYYNQKAKADADQILNLAKAKWSGFNPNLAQTMTPVEAPDMVGSLLQNTLGAKTNWDSLSKLFGSNDKELKEAAIKRQEEQDALVKKLSEKK